MSEYRTVDKTGWFIEKMQSGWFSRREIVQLAAIEFPNISEKTLDGTIGQCWSDSVRPEWSTWKAIRARGLKVVDSGGRRTIVEDGGASLFPEVNPRSSAGIPAAAELAATQLRRTGPRASAGTDIRRLWNSNDGKLWHEALDRYWSFVKPANLSLERELDQLDVEVVRAMGPREWYEFLLEKYFRWKYTAPNRFASTTHALRSYVEDGQLPALHAIKERLFELDKGEIQGCLSVARSIRGLGTAGASGLLAILFPAYFGTVDQFAVKALMQISELKERSLIDAMNPESLKIEEGAVLIHLMRMKAKELNRIHSTSEWTPRRVDMVLWASGR